MNNNIFFLLYRSTETEKLTYNSLNNLVLKSQQANKKNGLSGVLLKTKNGFLQYLEGDKTTITVLYEKLLRDKRHKNLIVIKKGYAKEKRFPYWSMSLLIRDINLSLIQSIEFTRRNTINFQFKSSPSKSIAYNLALEVVIRGQHLN